LRSLVHLIAGAIGILGVVGSRLILLVLYHLFDSFLCLFTLGRVLPADFDHAYTRRVGALVFLRHENFCVGRSRNLL
jgi:hypothetical protein